MRDREAKRFVVIDPPSHLVHLPQRRPFRPSPTNRTDGRYEGLALQLCKGSISAFGQEICGIHDKTVRPLLWQCARLHFRLNPDWMFVQVFFSHSMNQCCVFSRTGSSFVSLCRRCVRPLHAVDITAVSNYPPSL